MNRNDKIYVAGHCGMVGSALVRLLEEHGFDRLVLRTRAELDLRDAPAVEGFFKSERPDVVILAAATVGGIMANKKRPAEFLYNNLAMQNNVIHQSYLNGVRKFCFLGSSCIYPRQCSQPMKEEYILSGPLEPTNEGYALAKIAGLKMVEFYRSQYGFDGISVIPCNLYGTNDSYGPKHSHVVSALIRRFVDAVDEGRRSVTLWGTGRARREFMHVNDAAGAILHLMEHNRTGDPMNVGSGRDITINDLATMIASECGFRGEIAWDTSKPDGMQLKCLDVSRMNGLGYSARITLAEGIRKTIMEYRQIKKGGKSL